MLVRVFADKSLLTPVKTVHILTGQEQDSTDQGHSASLHTLRSASTGETGVPRNQRESRYIYDFSDAIRLLSRPFFTSFLSSGV